MVKWTFRAVIVAIPVVVVAVMRRQWRMMAVPDAGGVLDDMRRRLVDVRELASVSGASPSAANAMLNACWFGLHQVQVLREWGQAWLDAQDPTTRLEVNAAEREFKAYRRQAFDAGARRLPQDLPAL
jgi:hypothetical protein